jgi:DNA recombination protein RmuC
MIKLGSALGTTVNHYNATYKELGKVDRDIVKITDVEASVEPLLIEKPTLED